MKKLCCYLALCSTTILAQSIADCRQRFDSYLNFKGSLNKVVKFDSNCIYVLNGNKKQIAFYQEELSALNYFFSNSANDQHKKLITMKGTKQLSVSQLDSLVSLCRKNVVRDGAEPLKGIRIALDPGHFATNLGEARSEQKFLYFKRTTNSQSNDSVKLFESLLTFNTAKILQRLLAEAGAEVMLTRNNSNYTSFNCTYTEWLKQHKTRVLDSLEKAGLLTKTKHTALLNGDDYKFFWNFFRDYDLLNRVAAINAFKPDITVIIHYNVDEKNAPWKRTSEKNFTMTFIGGAFSPPDIASAENSANFARLLLGSQLNKSHLLAQHTVLNFNKNLGIPIASLGDADYLQNYCMATSSPGVFCRNLLLCRKVNSVLVYGESLYQDNDKEVELLMRSDVDSYGIKTNARVAAVSRSYYDAILGFYKNN